MNKMNPHINAFILDDEPNNINLLKKVLQKHCAHVNIIGTETDSESGIKLIQDLQPELVFLDIHMPNLSGFEVLKELEPVEFEVIFVTAFGEHALEAFDYHAIGYITKPIHPERLVAAVQNAQERIHQRKTTANIFSFLQNKMNEPVEGKMALATMSGMIFVNKEDIMYCESNRNCTNFYTIQGKKLVVSKQIGEYEKLLADTSFVRIHDQYIINLKYASEYIKGRGGEIKLNNDITLPVSAGRKDNLLGHFERWLKR
jgi:two-component system LytT family response regulator